MSWKYHCTKVDIHLKLWPKKKKAKGWGDLHAGYQHGRVSCLFPTAEFKASGVSDNLAFSLLLPFGSIILGCVISDSKDQHPLPPPSIFWLWPTGRSAINQKAFSKCIISYSRWDMFYMDLGFFFSYFQYSSCTYFERNIFFVCLFVFVVN